MAAVVQLNVDEQLAKYATEIAALRLAVPEIPAIPDGGTGAHIQSTSLGCCIIRLTWSIMRFSSDWDNIWLLRWCLSYPDDVSARTEALRKAIGTSLFASALFNCSMALYFHLCVHVCVLVRSQPFAQKTRNY